MFRFESPEYFYYFILIPIILLLYWYFNKSFQNKIKLFFSEQIYAQLTQHVSQKKRKWKLIFELVVVVLIILSLARPQMGDSTEKIKLEGFEVIFAIDVSNSMLAEDLKPSRLEVTKNSVERMLDRLPGYKIGLIAFAGSAALVSPLTTDYSAIRTFLSSINTDTISSQGTNIRAALEAALEGFNRGGAVTDETTKVTRVVVLFSDGEDHEEGALTAARESVKQGLRIFSIGIGTEQGAPIPIRDDFGQLKGYLKDGSQNTVLSKVNVGFLRKLASEGQGGYFHATFIGDEVKAIEAAFNKLEKTEFESDILKKYNERFQIPLVLALIFLVLELFMADYRKRKND